MTYDEAMNYLKVQIEKNQRIMNLYPNDESYEIFGKINQILNMSLIALERENAAYAKPTYRGYTTKIEYVDGVYTGVIKGTDVTFKGPTASVAEMEFRKTVDEIKENE